MIEIVVATRSAHKLLELRELLPELPGVRFLDLTQAGVPELPEEEGIEAFDTFEENALAKARYFARRAGRPILADDSGVCVDALDGAPGVRSKRFAGRTDLTGAELDRANNEHLLRALEGVPAERRTAHYVCVLALADPSGEEVVHRGACSGQILAEPRGDGGFGYDPLFLIPWEERTFGELSAARKNQISHRAQAARAMGEELLRRFSAA